GQKMSKSLGNVLLLRDLLGQAPGEAIRLALLSAHYRHPLDWNAQRLLTARQTLSRFYRGLKTVEHIEISPGEEPDEEVIAALNNDLNIPGALARLHVLLAELEKAGTDAGRSVAKARVTASGRLLGLFQQDPNSALQALAGPADIHGLATAADAARIDHLVAEREQARKRRDFARADALREELGAAGVLVHDTANGSTWTLVDGTPA
ncbi:MAG TPA: cysteine--tRNA ligase, partial [Cupriavidus sp.]|nr:cysteine--tRNA ligase [Cupriavidus sp.]